MTDMERMIWAAAFARVYADERAQNRFLRWEKEISGFHCAEIADEAVEKYREALRSDDSQYLLLITEPYVKGTHT